MAESGELALHEGAEDVGVHVLVGMEDGPVGLDPALLVTALDGGHVPAPGVEEVGLNRVGDTANLGVGRELRLHRLAHFQAALA